MPPEGAKLVFLNDPLSPLAVVLMAAAVAPLAAYRGSANIGGLSVSVTVPFKKKATP